MRSLKFRLIQYTLPSIGSMAVATFVKVNPGAGAFDEVVTLMHTLGGSVTRRSASAKSVLNGLCFTCTLREKGWPLVMRVLGRRDALIFSGHVGLLLPKASSRPPRSKHAALNKRDIAASRAYRKLK